MLYYLQSHGPILLARYGMGLGVCIVQYTIVL